ncbi:response regulator transcription factor [Spirochaeta dissipatitropha]
MNVMLVEDEQLLLEELAETFSWEGCGCRLLGTAGSYAEAVEKIPGLRIDLLITDIQLPDGNGIELVEQIRPKAAIIITGHSQIDYAQRALRAGVADFLLKPIDDAELRKAIQRAAERCADFVVHSKDAQPGSDVPQAGANPLVDEALRFIQRRFRDNVSLFEAAEDLQITEGHLASVFKAQTGQTFVQALTSYRLNIAYTLLKDPRYQILEVARKCGFNDPAYFTRVFKRRYGLSPSQFRTGKS